MMAEMIMLKDEYSLEANVTRTDAECAFFTCSQVGDEQIEQG